jgi:K+-sensing histidine kinase KdpD
VTGLLSRVLVPVAGEDDATTTARALARYLPEDAVVTAVYVVEKAGGAVDKASVEQREALAADAFAAFRAGLGVAPVDPTDVVEAIFEAADRHDDTAVAFVPREGSRWIRLLTGDIALSLVTENDRPVVALPSPAETADVDTETDADEERADPGRPAETTDGEAASSADEPAGADR